MEIMRPVFVIKIPVEKKIQWLEPKDYFEITKKEDVV